MRPLVIFAALALDLALVAAWTLLGVHHVLPPQTIAVLFTGLIFAHARRFRDPGSGAPGGRAPELASPPARQLVELSGAAALAAAPLLLFADPPGEGALGPGPRSAVRVQKRSVR